MRGKKRSITQETTGRKKDTITKVFTDSHDELIRLADH